MALINKNNTLHIKKYRNIRVFHQLTYIFIFRSLDVDQRSNFSEPRDLRGSNPPRDPRWGGPSQNNPKYTSQSSLQVIYKNKGFTDKHVF